MDILDRLVELAQVKGSVDVQCLFRGEWYVRHEPKRAHGLVHIVTAGSGYIRIDGEQEARLLSAGDVIFFPRSVGHTLSNDSSCENLGVNVLTSEKGALPFCASRRTEAANSGFFKTVPAASGLPSGRK